MPVTAAPASRPVRPVELGFVRGAPRRGVVRYWLTRAGVAAVLAVMLQTGGVAQTTPAVDPTIGLDRPFGLGGRSCKQYDDTGRLFIYSEGLPDIGIISWLQRSANGTRSNVPMPEALAQALPLMPGCLPGKHHAASASG